MARRRTPVPRPTIAFSVHASGSVADLVPQFQALKDMGATMARIDFQWTHIEPQGHDDSGASYDWTQNDADVAAAEQVGLQVDAVLAYGHPLYSTAGAANGSSEYPPDDPATFAQFAADVARRYQGRLAHYEVWNEENSGFRFWKPKADPAAYADLMCTSYDAIKAVAPDVLVSTGGVFMAPMGDLPSLIMGGTEFVDGMLTAMAGRTCFDAVAFHPYPYPFVSPEAVVTGNGDASMVTYAAQLRAVLDRHGVPASVPLWDTEVGWPTNPTANGVSEAKQAAYSVRGTLLSWATHVPVVTWYDQYDSGDADQTNNQESHFGFFHADGTPKPVVGAMTTLDRLVGAKGWHLVADLSRRLGLPAGRGGVGSGYALEFSGPKGRHVVALWYANETVPTGCSTGLAATSCPVTPGMAKAASIPVALPLRPRASAVRMTTMQGRVARLGRRVHVGQAPVYVSWTGRRL